MFPALLESFHVVVGIRKRAETDQRLTGKPDGDMLGTFEGHPPDVGPVTVFLGPYVGGEQFVHGAFINANERCCFPVLVVLNREGERIHTQDSWYLEQDKTYDREKVVQFFRMWNVAAAGS